MGQSTPTRSGIAQFQVKTDSTVTPPTITQAAASNPNPVAGTTTNLSVAATDAAAGADLTYTWSLVNGPATPSFSANGPLASANTVATFTAAGTYNLQVAVANAGGSVTSPVTVVVNQTLTSVTVNGKSWTQVASLGANATSYSDTTVKKNTGYSYRVAASNGYGTGAWSNVAKVTTPLREPTSSGEEEEQPVEWVGDNNGWHRNQQAALPNLPEKAVDAALVDALKTAGSQQSDGAASAASAFNVWLL